MKQTQEHLRLEGYKKRQSNWKKWGPYLSSRAWGTVREDYSEDGNAWNYFPHDMAISRTFRWNEDGLGGICDRNQQICFAFSFWNEKDPILKERFFGVSGTQGNHGEDVKECYFYLENLPTHSYMKMLYKYPQKAFPYEELVQKNQSLGLNEKEYELIDTKIFDENRYFDIFIEYAKASEDDILIQITLHNRGPEEATCYVLPTVWFRNTWAWGYPKGPTGDETGKPELSQLENSILLHHPEAGVYQLYAQKKAETLFTDNETNYQKLYGTENTSTYVKDAFHRALIEKEKNVVNPEKKGTKACFVYPLKIAGSKSKKICFRLSKEKHNSPFKDFDKIFSKRLREMNEFYDAIQKSDLKPELKNIQKLALSGMLWNKQFYYLDVEQWLKGDPATYPPPKSREFHRNCNWDHLVNYDILSMPDKWEYPYYCSWDMAFHCLPLTLLDADYAKRQLLLITREWYMHPNGQLPAYEWSFSDVNPPVQAWATWRCYKMDGKIAGKHDRDFLKRIFDKLLLNFTWWVNKKDQEGNNIFQGGFLGMDNISVFDRSRALPTGGHIDQSDASAWMAFYCITMLKISLELSMDEPIYQDMASKFFEHFLRIAHAMDNCGNVGHSLWNNEDHFFYDALHLPNGTITPLKVRSLVGLLPLLAVETVESSLMEKVPEFSRRLSWFVDKKSDVTCNMACMFTRGCEERRIMSVMNKEKLLHVLRYMLDENEFLSDFGIRSVSKFHEKNPYTFYTNGTAHTVRYLPGESDSKLFGGNSNWRGPIWFPINLLIIEALQKYHHYYGDELKVEFPTGSGKFLTLWEVSQELSKRLVCLFLKDPSGKAPFFGDHPYFQKDPHWKDLLIFNEYFHGDRGYGLGASHQTGWTGLVAKLIHQCGEQL